MNYNELVSHISFATFSEVISISPRKVRESLYSHYNIKAKGGISLSALKEKKDQKIRKLHDVLKDAGNPKEQEFIKELFRNWLFHKRPMLKAALDFLKVENDNGLIEIEPTFFKELKADEAKALVVHLKPNFPADDILIYLTFMEVPAVEKYLN
jgi:hypothetical protein